MSIEMNGIVRNTSSHPIAGYTVAWNGLEILEGGKAQRPRRLVATIEASGKENRFRMPLPSLEDRPTLLGPSRFEVLAPSGTLTGELDLDKEETAKVLAARSVELKAAGLPLGTLSRSDDPALGRPERLTGLVLRVGDGARIGSAQVLLWGRIEPALPPVLLATAQSDRSGYFFCTRPRQVLAQAFATVSGYSGSVEIALDEDRRLPERLIIGLLAKPDAAPLTAARCCTSAAIPKAVDADMLALSDAYSEDLGSGRCMDLTVPSRAVEEFSYYMVLRTTDPEIQGLSLPPPPRQTAFGDLIDSFQVYGIPLDPGQFDDWARSTLNRSATGGVHAGKQVDAQSAPRIPPTVSRALRQIDDQAEAAALATWSKRTAGRAPLSATNPVDWDNEPTFYQATTICHGHLLQFKQVWKAAGYSLGDLLYSLPLAPLQKKQIAIIDWDRRDAATRTEATEAEDSLQAALSHDRVISDIVSAVLSETTRGGSSASTASSAAAVGFFGGPQVPLFGGVAGGASNASSSAWQDSGREIAGNALSTLSEATFQSASSLRSQRATVVQQVAQGESTSVSTEVVSNHNHCHALTMEYFEVLRHFVVEHVLASVRECLFIPLEIARFDEAKALRWREPLLRGFRDRRLAGAFDSVDRQLNTAFYAGFPAVRYADDEILEIWGQLGISFQIPRPADGEEDLLDQGAWAPYQPLLWDSPSAIFNLYLAGRPVVERELIFKQTIAPRIAEAFVDQLKFRARDTSGSELRIPLDSTLLANYAEGVALPVSLRSKGGLSNGLTRAMISSFCVESEVELPPYSKVIVRSGTIRYRTEHLEHTLFASSMINNDLKPGPDRVEIACPLSSREQLNPRKQDEELSARLVAHLNEHIEYYHKLIWWFMDPDRRYMLLDGFEAPHGGGRSVASVVENRVAAIIGNSLVMPVAPGFALDPAFKREGNRPGAQPIDLLEHYAPAVPPAPVRISVPTKGVFAEAVMGSCNSCEKIDDSRFWKFEEHPSPDEPASIAPVDTASRVEPAPNLQPSGLGQPIIAMQSAPAAPDPLGLREALQVLGTSSLFDNVTGLNANQRNAAAALQSTLTSATTMGLAAAGLQGKAIDRAAEIEKQRLANENADRIRQDILDARNEGLMSEDDARRHMDEQTRQQIGIPPAPTPMTSTLTEAIGDASESDKPFTYSGEAGTLSVGTPAPAGQDMPLPPLLTQSTDDTDHLWALAATVQPASMCLSSIPAAGQPAHQLVVRDERLNLTIFGNISQPEDAWRGDLVTFENGTRVSNLAYRASGISATVFERIEWLPVEIRTLPPNSGQSIQLPLTAEFLIAHATVLNASIPDRSHGLYRLESSIEHGRLHVFGYVVSPDGTFRVITPQEAGHREFKAQCNSFGGPGSFTVLAAVELVACRPDPSYEPSGWLNVARLYPLAAVWASTPLDSARADIRLRRPAFVAASPQDGLSLYPGGEMKPTLLTEMNGELATRTGSGPYRWDTRYAHYMVDARGRESIVVVNPALRVERSSQARGIFNRETGTYDPTSVVKRAVQGAFDAVVIGPTLLYESAPPGRDESVTAPLSPPGTVHIHWRWGDSLANKAALGWGAASEPHTAEGAPLVPWNQALTLRFDEGATLPGFVYSAEARPADIAYEWQVFMHHGCGYVTGMTAGSSAILVAGEVPDGYLPNWANHYHHNRYTTDISGNPVARLDEASFPTLEQL